MTRTNRRRFPILFAALVGLALATAMLFSPVRGQEDSAPSPGASKPRRPTARSCSPGTTPRTTASPAT